MSDCYGRNRATLPGCTPRNSILIEANKRSKVRGAHQPVRIEARPGRNEPCPCGSGKKFKRCCL